MFFYVVYNVLIFHVVNLSGYAPVSVVFFLFIWACAALLPEINELKGID